MGFFIFFLLPKLFTLLNSPSYELPPEFAVYILIALVGSFLLLGAMSFFIAYILKSPKFSSTTRLLWILFIAFMGAIAAPIFFWAIFISHPNSEPFFGNNDGARLA